MKGERQYIKVTTREGIGGPRMVIDVSNEASRAMRLWRIEERRDWAVSFARTMGYEGEVLFDQYKRGVSNVGFKVTLWPVKDS